MLKLFSLRRLEISLAVALAAAIVLPLCVFAYRCGEVREEVVRLHILANSDSYDDQYVKLLVRDAVLSAGTRLFDGSADVDSAERLLLENEAEIERTANEVLRENGFSYSADLFFTEEYFDTRAYEGFTLPAGKYKAVKIILGEGNGHNWWCVMFPPLCLPAASEKADIDVYLGSEAKIVEGNGKYEIRFKIVELFQKLKKF